MSDTNATTDAAAAAVPPASDVTRGVAGAGGRTLYLLAAAVVLFVGIWLARDILAPAAIAAVIVIIAHPVRYPLERRGWPSWLATTMVIVVAYAILIVLALLMIVALDQFVGLLPSYLDELRATADGASSWLASLGIGNAAGDATAAVLNPSMIAGLAGQLLGLVTSGAAAFFFVFAYMIFMAADASSFGRAIRAGRLFGPYGQQIATRYFSGVRRYYVVNASFGLVVAVLDGLVLWAIGIPIPLVWAILAFVTNFVPNIGFVLGLIPPLVLALVVGGWPLALVVLATYSVINVVLQVLVQPKFVSDAVSLGLTLTFFSVVFWTLVIGPAGAILSIPLTLLVRAVFLEPDSNSLLLRRLTGDT